MKNLKALVAAAAILSTTPATAHVQQACRAQMAAVTKLMEEAKPLGQMADAAAQGATKNPSQLNFTFAIIAAQEFNKANRKIHAENLKLIECIESTGT